MQQCVSRISLRANFTVYVNLQEYRDLRHSASRVTFIIIIIYFFVSHGTSLDWKPFRSQIDKKLVAGLNSISLLVCSFFRIALRGVTAREDGIVFVRSFR